MKPLKIFPKKTRKMFSKKLFELQKELIGKFPPIYDVRVFEFLPLKVKASVMEGYKILFGNPLEISEYFYFWRKMWNDFSHRIEYHESVAEKIKAIKRGGEKLRDKL